MGPKKFVAVYTLKNVMQSEGTGDFMTDEYDLNDIKKEIEGKRKQKISIAHERIDIKDNRVLLILTCVERG